MRPYPLSVYEIYEGDSCTIDLFLTQLRYFIAFRNKRNRCPPDIDVIADEILMGNITNMRKRRVS